MNVVVVIALFLGGAIIHCLWVATTVIRYEWFLAFHLRRIERNRLKAKTHNARDQ